MGTDVTVRTRWKMKTTTGDTDGDDRSATRLLFLLHDDDTSYSRHPTSRLAALAREDPVFFFSPPLLRRDWKSPLKLSC